MVRLFVRDNYCSCMRVGARSLVRRHTTHNNTTIAARACHNNGLTHAREHRVRIPAVGIVEHPRAVTTANRSRTIRGRSRSRSTANRSRSTTTVNHGRSRRRCASRTTVVCVTPPAPPLLLSPRLRVQLRDTDLHNPERLPAGGRRG